MAELSKHVPIIPVIMKADTMTIHEAQRFRQEVVNRLQNPSERPRSYCQRKSGSSHLRETRNKGCCHSCSPYAGVVGVVVRTSWPAVKEGSAAVCAGDCCWAVK